MRLDPQTSRPTLDLPLTRSGRPLGTAAADAEKAEKAAAAQAAKESAAAEAAAKKGMPL